MENTTLERLVAATKLNKLSTDIYLISKNPLITVEEAEELLKVSIKINDRVIKNDIII